MCALCGPCKSDLASQLAFPHPGRGGEGPQGLAGVSGCSRCPSGRGSRHPAGGYQAHPQAYTCRQVGRSAVFAANSCWQSHGISILRLLLVASQISIRFPLFAGWKC